MSESRKKQSSRAAWRKPQLLPPPSFHADPRCSRRAPPCRLRSLASIPQRGIDPPLRAGRPASTGKSLPRPAPTQEQSHRRHIWRRQRRSSGASFPPTHDPLFIIIKHSRRLATTSVHSFSYKTGVCRGERKGHTGVIGVLSVALWSLKPKAIMAPEATIRVRMRSRFRTASGTALAATTECPQAPGATPM